MENKILQHFITEAENYLPTIRCEILLCSQEDISGGELETSLRYVQLIKESALSAGLQEIVTAGENLERQLSWMVKTKQLLSPEQSRNLLDNLAALEALLAKLHFAEDDFPLNLDGFVDESFDNLWFGSGNESGPAAPAPDEMILEADDESELEGFEIDEEMLEIFAMEADDLLRNIGSHLEVLKSKPSDREALLEIRRNAHTLKGSAGIVGLKSLSGLAHRVEDLLDFMAEKEIEVNQKIIELLFSSTDCLSALANGEKSTQLSAKIKLLYQSFDETLELLQTPAAAPVQAEAKAPEVSVPVPAAGSEPEAKPADYSVITHHKSVVRVSLEKLDELVRLVSDLVISRSVFEQRLVEFERQIIELQDSTGRLKRSTGKLETDFEASMLQVPGSRFQAPGQISGPALGSQHPALNFDALEFDRYTEFHQTTRELLETTGDASAINVELDNLRGNLEMLFSNQSRLIEEMQDKLLRLRMVRFGSLVARLQRTVRVTCEQEKKQAELFIEGEQTEVDTQILDLLAEPLLHLLRNAVAHGIESPDTRRLLGKPENGKINLRLHSEGTHIVLSVSDDGRGISASALKEKAVRNGFVTQADADQMNDQEAFLLGFLPGLTTAESVRQTAGRGVGMNIIKNSILRGQGTISIASEPQKGTTFTIRLPMALAVTRGILVRSGNGQTFAFPLKLVKQVSEISSLELEKLDAQNILPVDGVNYAVSHLDTLLGLPAAESARDNVSLLLLETLETPRALIVEEVARAEEIVIKPLGSPLQNFPHLLGATILGDGSIVPVLDLLYLLKNQVPGPKSRVQSPVESETSNPASESRMDSESEIQNPKSKIQVMVVDDSPSVRHITSKLVKTAGWEVLLAKDGQEALEILQATDVLPNIVLTDVEMPRMDGYQLTSSLKSEENLKKIPIIMITSRATEKHRQKALESGVSEYLTKPYDDSVLIETIKNLLPA